MILSQKHAPISPWHGLHQLRQQGLHVLVLRRFETLPFSDMPRIAAIMFVSTERFAIAKKKQNKPEPYINKSQIYSASAIWTQNGPIMFYNFLNSSIFAFAKLHVRFCVFCWGCEDSASEGHDLAQALAEPGFRDCQKRFLHPGCSKS